MAGFVEMVGRDKLGNKKNFEKRKVCFGLRNCSVCLVTERKPFFIQNSLPRLEKLFLMGKVCLDLNHFLHRKSFFRPKQFFYLYFRTIWLHSRIFSIKKTKLFYRKTCKISRQLFLRKAWPFLRQIFYRKICLVWQ